MPRAESDPRFDGGADGRKLLVMSTPAKNASPWIIQPTRESFAAEVIERSHELPVVVDFWAAWCQPCRMLTPMLEKLAREYGGKFLLAKVDTEKLREAAAEFGVQSIPAVYGLRDGQVIDFFVGLLPEEAVRQWLDRLQPAEWEVLTAEGDKLAVADAAAAEERYRRAVALAPAEPRPKIALASLLVEAGRLRESRELIEALEARGFLEPEAADVKAVLDVRLAGESAGSVQECRAAAEAEPGNIQRRFALAEALAAAGQHEESLQLCLSIVQNDRHGRGDDARKLMIDLFRLIGDDAELTHAYRRKLSAALY